MKHNKQAFTLIELLVVVLIIGILAAVALPQYQKAVMRARLAEYRINLDTLAKAATTYNLANDQLFQGDDLSALDITLPECKPLPGISSDYGCRYGIFVGNGHSASPVVQRRLSYGGYETILVLPIKDQPASQGGMKAGIIYCGVGQDLCKQLGFTSPLVAGPLTFYF